MVGHEAALANTYIHCEKRVHKTLVIVLNLSTIQGLASELVHYTGLGMD